MHRDIFLILIGAVLFFTAQDIIHHHYWSVGVDLVYLLVFCAIVYPVRMYRVSRDE
jgi:hypothetical protein